MRYTKFSLKINAILFPGMLIVFFALSFVGINPINETGKVFQTLLVVIFMIYGIYYFKRFENSGELRFWEGLAVYLQIVVFAGIFYSIFLFVYLHINDALFVEWKQQMLDTIISQESSFLDEFDAAERESLYKSVSETSIGSAVSDNFLKIVFLSSIFGLIGSVFFRS